MARFTATVDFPTPPLPLATAMISRIPGSLFPEDAGADAVGFELSATGCGAGVSGDIDLFDLDEDALAWAFFG